MAAPEEVADLAAEATPSFNLESLDVP